MKRPGMLYGAMLRSPTYKGKLASVDVEPAKAMDGVFVVQDGSFVGVAAPTSFRARQAIEALAATAKWDSEPIPSSEELYDFLREHAEGDALANPFAEEVKARRNRCGKSITWPMPSTRRSSRGRRLPNGPMEISRCGLAARIRLVTRGSCSGR